MWSFAMASEAIPEASSSQDDSTAFQPDTLQVIMPAALHACLSVTEGFHEELPRVVVV